MAVILAFGRLRAYGKSLRQTARAPIVTEPKICKSLNRRCAKLMRQALERWLHTAQSMSAIDVTPELSSGSAIVFAPHPDDEVLGCGGTIALKVQAGAKVTIVVMTDGRTSHAGRIPMDELIRRRRAEALEAADRLGLPSDSCVFLDFPDSELAAHAFTAGRRVEELLARYSPRHVFVPSRRDSLTDHIATFNIVRSAIRRSRLDATLFEYPVWLWQSWPWAANSRPGLPTARDLVSECRNSIELVARCRARVSITAALPRKLHAMAAYKSQMQRQDNDSDWPILADVDCGRFLDRFTRNHEIFRRTDLKR